jgi:hypothetical protein
VTAEGIQPHIIRLVPSKLVPIADLQRQWFQTVMVHIE